MAYSETQVLIGGLAHVPVIIGLFLFFNNTTKKNSKDGNSQSANESFQVTQSFASKDNNDARGGGLLTSDNLSGHEIEQRNNFQPINQSISKNGDNYTNQDQDSEVKKVEAEGMEKAKDEATKITLDRRQKTGTEAEKLELEINQETVSEGQTYKEKEEDKQSTEIEARLKEQVARLEAEAALMKGIVGNDNANAPSPTEGKNKEILQNKKRYNPWQIAAIAVLVIGGTMIFLSNSSNNESKDSSGKANRVNSTRLI